MSLRHLAPGKLLDACRFWYPEPRRTRKLALAGAGYHRVSGKHGDPSRLEDWADGTGRPSIESEWERLLLLTPDQFAYDSLWLFGPPNVPGGSHCEELNGVTLCVFGPLTEDEARKSPDVDRFDPKWRTEAVLGIASKAYDERAFAVLPILADALEEAGCDNLPMLAHCREAAIHARGCWVLDHILGKG